ncbi:MAG: metallophosphoesterase [Nanoarchaeota archaeon]
MIKYIDKCLLINENGLKLLAIGDIHIGYGAKESAWAMINGVLFDDMIKEFEIVFSKIGKVDKIVLLGDLKNDFSYLSEEERNGIVNLIDYLETKCEEVIIVRGNHDNYLLNLTSKRGLLVKDFFCFDSYCFLHGDRDFSDIYDKKIKYWIMGHLHPAIKLREGNKTEKYKCFLSGEYKGKKIKILPSFSGVNVGIDVRELEKEMVWNFNLKKFDVFVVSDDLKVIDFGELRKIK